MVRIDEFKFGEMSIDGKTYFSDIMIWWDGRVEMVEKPEMHEIGINELAMLLQNDPDIIVIGTGIKRIIRVLPEVTQSCRDKKIKLYSDPTPKAAEFFNGLCAQEKRAAGFFHLTC